MDRGSGRRKGGKPQKAKKRAKEEQGELDVSKHTPRNKKPSAGKNVFAWGLCCGRQLGASFPTVALLEKPTPLTELQGELLLALGGRA